MNYEEYASRIRSYRALAEVNVYGSVAEDGREHPLYELTVPGKNWLLITAGFHGEEPAGPFTLREHFEEIVDFARSLDVGLRVFPCINPSGFEHRRRYNSSGERPNNDFLRYEVSPGTWLGELATGQRFLRHALFTEGPKETRALCAALERVPNPAAALDLHQDNHLAWPATYAYVFGGVEHYLPLVRASSKHAKVAARVAVDEHHKTDQYGLLHHHDGSVTDYFLRRGVRFTAALETTTRTPLDACHRVNLIWIKGFIELAARGNAGERS